MYINAEGNADGNLDEQLRRDAASWRERRDKINAENVAIIAANRAQAALEDIEDNAFDAELAQRIASRRPKPQ